MNPNIYFFTFDLGKPLAKYTQPIRAKDADAARAKMFELYGAKWAFQYDEAAYHSNPHFVDHVLLPMAYGEFDHS